MLVPEPGADPASAPPPPRLPPLLPPEEKVVLERVPTPGRFIPPPFREVTVLLATSNTLLVPENLLSALSADVAVVTELSVCAATLGVRRDEPAL